LGSGPVLSGLAALGGAGPRDRYGGIPLRLPQARSLPADVFRFARFHPTGSAGTGGTGRQSPSQDPSDRYSGIAESAAGKGQAPDPAAAFQYLAAPGTAR